MPSPRNETPPLHLVAGVRGTLPVTNTNGGTAHNGKGLYAIIPRPKQDAYGRLLKPLAVPVPTGQVWKVYYYASAQTRSVAMREISGTTGSSTLYYLHSDHLGSTSLVTNASGGVVSRQSYYAYGAPRNQQGALPTDKTFTGQRAESSSLGSLMDFNARFFSPLSGRFLSADTVVPGAGNPQALNRYMYVLGNPVRYTDPSGHGVDCGIGTNCVRQPNKPHEQQDRRDLTKWMPRGLVRMATDPRIEAIAAFPDVLWGKHLAFASLVGDEKPFDIKVSHKKIADPAGLKLGDNWYEYSTPGNIAYGFRNVSRVFGHR